jgi:UDP-N-acetylmuramoyl-L-alanine---L-glutamate ligase
MRIEEFAGKTVCILGFGREGQAVLGALERYAPTCEITIADSNEKVQIEGAKHWKQLGTGWLENLEKFDAVIKSPGIPPNPVLKALGKKLTSSTQIFLDTVKAKGSTVIGITGSKGKSTTTSLIYAVLKAAGKDAHLVGNIGIPAIDFIEKADKDTMFVLEMSSYQLMDLTTSPDIAVITSFFPEHLDYHGSLAAYHEAKRHIARHQTKSDAVFFNSSFPETVQIAEESPGKKTPFTSKDSPVTLTQIKLLGEHNLGNIAGAYAVAKYLGVKDDVSLPVIKAFEGLPHRLQSIGTHGGIEWIDDSISTTPESAVAGLRALGDRVHTVILGGQDRGYDFLPLVEELRDATHVHHIILLPASGHAIKKAAERLGLRTTLYEVTDMPGAVKIAKEVTERGKLCLLSPASPSYGFFKNFEERGEKFKAAIIQN